MRNLIFWIWCLLLVVCVCSIYGFLCYPQKSLILDNFHDIVETFPRPFYPDSLQSLCNATEWDSHLLINCTNILPLQVWEDPLDAIKIRNSVVVCLRWAIDGGLGFIMPRISIRSKNDDTQLSTNYGDLSLLFDVNNMRQELSQKCPQLKVYDTDYKDFSILIFNETRDPQRNAYTFREYRKYIKKLLYNRTTDVPTVIWEDKPILGWKFNKEGINIHRTLYNIVQFQPAFRTLGVRVANKILKGKYLGLDLRLEEYKYEQILSWFKELWSSSYSDIDTVYVSANTQNIEEKFRTDLMVLNLNILSKWSLASNDAKLQIDLNELILDQLLVVDYEVMIRSYIFFGSRESSLSYGVYFERGNGRIENCRCHSFQGMDETFVAGF